MMPTYSHVTDGIELEFGVHRDRVPALRQTIIHRWIKVTWRDLDGFARFAWQQEIVRDGAPASNPPTTYWYALDRATAQPRQQDMLSVTTPGLAGMGSAFVEQYIRVSPARAERLSLAFDEYPPLLAETAAAAEYLAGVL